MTPDIYPLQVLLVTLAGWVNRRQQHVIEYLVEENRVLKEQLTGRRLQGRLHPNEATKAWRRLRKSTQQAAKHARS